MTNSRACRSNRTERRSATPRAVVALLTTVAVVVVATMTTSSAALVRSASPSAPGPVGDSQDPTVAPFFVGHPVDAHPLGHKTRYQPFLALMHGDAGNTDTTDFPGPLGEHPVVGSAQTLTLTPFMWSPRDELTTGCVSPGPSGVAFCLAAVEPHSLTVEARWFPPPGQALNLAYMTMDGAQRILATTRQGQVFVVQRVDGAGGPTFRLLRHIDLTSLLRPEELLLAAMFDDDGNIWFTTGGILGAGDQPAPFTTLGYIDPRGGIHPLHLADQFVENGFAIDGDTAYVVTGPAGPADHPGAVGYLYALRANARTGTVDTLWREAYDAGDARKPGGFARGSGATVTLVGTRYVTITDNANPRVNLLVFHRDRIPPAVEDRPDPRLVCKVPLFHNHASAVDVSPIGDKTHDTHSMIAVDDYNSPPLSRSAPTNGSYNNVNGMAPGIERVDVNPDGAGCHPVWDTPIRIKDVPYLSTATGLVYGYTQDPHLAARGIYVWYFVAIDYTTGKIVWEVRSGGGGTMNDDYQALSVGPDGTLYQGLPLGVAWMRDGTRAREPGDRP